MKKIRAYRPDYCLYGPEGNVKYAPFDNLSVIIQRLTSDFGLLQYNGWITRYKHWPQKEA